MPSLAAAVLEPPTKRAFTTIKVPENVRKWLKIEAAMRGVPMYVVLMSTLTTGNKKKPWEQVA